MAMTKAEIMAKVVNDAASSRFAFGNPSDDNAEYGEEEIAATLRVSLEKLPTGARVRVCADFSDLHVECCDTCHHFDPHFEMALIDIEPGGNAWICCALDRALNPFKYAQRQGSLESQEIEWMLKGDVIC